MNTGMHCFVSHFSMPQKFATVDKELVDKVEEHLTQVDPDTVLKINDGQTSAQEFGHRQG